MKKLFLIIIFTFISFQANAKNAALEKARNAAGQCERKFKTLDLDAKFNCLMKVTYYLEMQDQVLQNQILNLQLNTTGY